MRTTRAVRGRALSGALLAGALVLATVAPAAAQDTASAVKGIIDDCLTITQGTTTTGPGASAVTINQIWECNGETDDERLNGKVRLVYNIAGWTDVGAIQYGWITVENDGGSWNGAWSATVRESGEQTILAWYEGTGDYEGWSYIETQNGDYQQERETFGIVYPGSLPPNIEIRPVTETEAPLAL